ncbi:MAG TPA: hypothetical protein VMH04_09240 [Candidatus Solibacter sp.]|nr:hypothetical protein [Candidatus Solibacter sp.]
MLPSLSCGNRKCVRIVLLLLIFSVFGSLASAQTDNWVGTSGNWSDGSQWDSGVPIAGDNIVISTATANSTDDMSLAINGLTLGNSSDVLIIGDGIALNVSGPISNAGSIQMGSAGANTFLQITGNVSATGSGNITLPTTGPNFITGASGTGTEVLTSANTIQGSGNIGNGAMGFVNSGTVIAPNTAANLFINVSSAGFSNTGTLEAVTGGNLVIQGPANSFTNYNATTGTLTGGTYTANGGNIYFTGSSKGITTLSARVTQEANGQIINAATGTNALGGLQAITATGVLTTTAGFTAPHAFNMAGALNILPNTVVNVGSVTQIKTGSLTGGQWVLDSSLNITGTAQHLTTNNATVTLSGGTFKNVADGSDAFATLTTNKKTLRIMNFAHYTTTGTLTNTSQMLIQKGCNMTIGGTSTSYAQTAGKMTMDGMLKGAVNVTGGSFLGAGSVTGNFSLGGGTGNATFSVGDAGKAAQFKITGTYTQLTNGILSVNIGGTTVATQYSQVKPTLAATLGGTLTAPLIAGFTPTVGQAFTVVSGKSVTGTFSNSTIAINSSEHFAISYTATGVVLTVASGPAAE